MITNFNYTPAITRDRVMSYLEFYNFKRVIDLGGAAADWSAPYVSHCVDIKPSPNMNTIIGDLCSYELWTRLLEEVKANGKFDFAICSHTLEDIANPKIVCEMLPQIAKEGFIAVPSKYKEFIKQGDHYGYMHHRWVFNKEDGEFVGYPKLPFLEHDPVINKLYSGKPEEQFDELQFFWKGDFRLYVINADYMGPNDEYVRSYFKGLLND